ncbi:MAG: hypothetical protein R2778_14315 [Saprospiraceae bacterium]
MYKSTDGGKSWTQTLFVDNFSGAIDLVIDPDDPNILYAASWERKRYAWDFIGAGKVPAFGKSEDGQYLG